MHVNEKRKKNNIENIKVKVTKSEMRAEKVPPHCRVNKRGECGDEFDGGGWGVVLGVVVVMVVVVETNRRWFVEYTVP